MALPGYIGDDQDCDDSRATVHPGAEEVCDNRDNDCDGSIDGDAVDAGTFFRDVDGDGYGDPGRTQVACWVTSGYCTDGTDCDDLSPSHHPGADEVCDGDDDDCDGSVDEEDAVDARSWYPDADGDGFGAPGGVPTDSCIGPPGTSDQPTDCDDGDPGINPAATDTCDDLVDQDCDGVADSQTWYLDADGDTFGRDASPSSECGNPAGYTWRGGDCDDTSATVYPGAPDACMDARDNDCDGVVDTCSLLDADAVLVGEAEDDLLGHAVAGAGDLDGDGLDDIAVAAPYNDRGGSLAGAVYVFTGPVSGWRDASEATAVLVGDFGADAAGWSLSGAGDVNGDGLADLLIGAPSDDGGALESGTAYLVLGPLSGERSLADADAVLLGESTADSAGTSVAGLGDVDGDGYGDLLVGAPDHDYGGTGAGVAYLVRGPVEGVIDLAFADTRFIGENGTDRAGAWVAAAGDLDGDGLADLLIGAPQADSGGTYSGAAYVVYGPVDHETFDLSEAAAELRGETSYDYAAASVAGLGDVDGNGTADLLVGATAKPNSGGWSSGGAYLVYGPVYGQVNLDNASCELSEGNDHDARGGAAVAGAGDVNGDGFHDLLVGSPGYDTGGEGRGAAYLLYGPVTGEVALSVAHVAFVGLWSGDKVGSSLAGAGDVDGDGYDDLLIGAPGDDTGADDAGAVYLWRGREL